MNRKVVLFLLFSFILSVILVGQINAQVIDPTEDDPTLFPMLITPNFHDFGSVDVGSSKQFTFVFKHKSGSDKILIAGVVKIDSPFQCVNCSYNLGKGKSTNITIKFRPTKAGNFSRVLFSSHGGGAVAKGVGVGSTTGVGSASNGTKCIPIPGKVVCIDNPLNTGSLTEIIDEVINFIFRAALVVAPLMILYGGFLFVTGGGNPEQISRGKNVLMWTVIGLIVIILSKGLITLLQTALGVNGS